MNEDGHDYIASCLRSPGANLPAPGTDRRECLAHPADTHAELRRVFEAAIYQSQKGKGAVRHQEEGELFEEQQIVEIGRRLGGISGPLYQAVKKCYEATGMLHREEVSAAKAELLGALNYIAAAYLLLEERE